MTTTTTDVRAPDRTDWKLPSFLCLSVLVFSYVKSFRLPIEYPSTQLALSYDAGFIKRGFLGSILFYGDTPISYWRVALYSTAVSLIFIGILTYVSSKILRTYPELFLFVLLFSSSIGIVYFASINGYFDITLVVLAASAALMPNAFLCGVSVVVFGTVAILVHEAACLMVLPLMYFSMYVRLRRYRQRLALVVIGGVALCHASLTYLVAQRGVLTEQWAEALRSALQARSDFELIDLPFRVLTTPAMSEARRAMNVDVVAHVDSLVIAAPALVPLLCLLLYTLKRDNAGLFVGLFATAAALSPSALRFFGTDIHRWDSLAIITTFITLYVVLSEPNQRKPVALDWSWVNPTLAALLVVSASTTTFLFTDGEIRGFPFLELRRLALDAWFR